MSRRLVYIANARFPTEKAHGLQIAKMCEAFARLGYEVELWLPQRKNHIRQDPYDFYDVAKNFKLRFFPVIDLVGVIPRLGFWLENVTFTQGVARALRTEPDDTIIYSRDQISLYWLTKKTKRKCYFEFHNPPHKVMAQHKHLWSTVSHIFAINQLTADFLQRQGIETDKITVSPSAIDEQFLIDLRNTDSAQLRHQLNINQQKKIMVYTGHLYPEKGIDTLLAAITMLPNYHLCLVGGIEELVAYYRSDASQYGYSDQVTFVGWVPHREVAKYLAIADILVLSNSVKYEESSSYTSPMKALEYVASGKPIVASDVPALREVFHDHPVTFFTADDASSLAEAVMKARPSSGSSSQLLTWDQRAKMISEKFS